VAERVEFRSLNPAFDGETIQLDWRDSVTVHVGVEHNWRSGWSVRAGYAFWQNSIPSRTFTPLDPDSDERSFSGGFDYTWKRVAYQFALGSAHVGPLCGSVEFIRLSAAFYAYFGR
jgi:long-subunit fatty acid transport protein